MATKEKKSSNAVYWIGGAVATAGVYYFVTRYLQERDELQQMRLMHQLQEGKSNPKKSKEKDDED